MFREYIATPFAFNDFSKAFREKFTDFQSEDFKGDISSHIKPGKADRRSEAESKRKEDGINESGLFHRIADAKATETVHLFDSKTGTL